MKTKVFLLSLMATPIIALAGEISSPDGNVKVVFYIDDNGRPTYEMTYKDKPVMLPSHLGFELAKDKHASKKMEETDLLDNFRIVDERRSTFDETWTPVWGETKTIRNHYNELETTLRQEMKVEVYKGDGTGT